MSLRPGVTTVRKTTTTRKTGLTPQRKTEIQNLAKFDIIFDRIIKASEPYVGRYNTLAEFVIAKDIFPLAQAGRAEIRRLIHE